MMSAVALFAVLDPTLGDVLAVPGSGCGVLGAVFKGRTEFQAEKA